MRAYLRRAPVHCTWQLSPRCESFCHLCEHRPEAAAQELDTEGCTRVAAGLATGGSLLVSFTGSEPFLREDLPQVVAAAARWHFPLLVTNGWLVSRARARAVWQAGLEVASVAVEHADPAQHDAVSGLPGSHARAVAALEALSHERTRRGQRVNVRTRLRGGGTEGLARLLALAARHRATVSLEAAYPLPQLDGEAGRLVAELRRLKREHPNLRTSAALLERTGEALRGGVGGCLAGRAFFNVDHRGRVSRCLEFRSPGDLVGGLEATGLGALRPALQRKAAGNECRACFYASRAEVETLFSLRGFVSGLRTLVSG